jgi:dihydrofolate reductase
MRKIVYYVATSIDGYIMGADENMAVWVLSGDGIAQYTQDLANFDTVLMGRKTYEFGYKYGLQAGQTPYVGMQNYVFSDNLHIENPDANLHICPLDIEIIKNLKQQEGKDIYLCGGGELANWLLAHQQIDVLKIKLNPLLVGKGVRLFGNAETTHTLILTDSQLYENGLQILTYTFQYHS